MFLILPGPSGSVTADPWLSAGRKADPTAKTLSEIRQAEKRQIPLEVLLKASDGYPVGGAVDVTVIVTNLFDPPLLMNRRMLVNHPRLQGEIAFRIVGPGGQKHEIKRLITPLALRDEGFVMLPRGQSIQRTVDLEDLYGLTAKGIYKVQVSYHNEVDYPAFGLRAWKGIVWSEPVEIRLE